MKNVLFIDGHCLVCNTFVLFIINMDKNKKIFFSNLQGNTAKKILPDNYIKDLDTIVLYHDDKILTKSSAIIKAFSLLGWPWKAVVCFNIIPKPIRDFFYELFAKNRYKIKERSETCPIPPKDIRPQFLP